MGALKNTILTFLLIISGHVYGQMFEIPDYAPSTIIIKLRTESNASPQNSNAGLATEEHISAKLAKMDFNEQKQLFPRKQTFNSRSIPQKHDLSRIYKLTLQEGQNLFSTIKYLSSFPEIEYAEPYYLSKPLFIPNDTDAQAGGPQDYLEVIKAYSAWNIERGDSNIVIGVIDSGVRLNHEDIKDNIKYNYDDPINGIDDEGDGYIDNFYGWDMSDNDNDPSDDQSTHGTSVAGFSAKTNNNLGLAGVGFNCKFLPIKIFKSSTGGFNGGYEAIVYAAQHGCQVVNLSWGGINNYSQFAQDVINHVVIDLDVVVVAAAGNTNDELDFYPASYDNVLSVGATNIADAKWALGTYSNFIDIMAPGVSVYTAVSDSYGFSSGSSFSSPQVAGAAALLRSRYPQLNALQIMERLRVNADNIYSISENQQYNELLGKGRLNIYRALIDNSSPSIRMLNYTYNNGAGQYAFFGDTISITADFINYLSTTSNAKVTISSESPYVSLIDSTFNIGSLGTLQGTNNKLSPFRIFLSEDMPSGTELKFRLGYQDGFYDDFQYIKIFGEPDYVTVSNSNMAISVGADGDLGYNPSSLSYGVGITYKGVNILNEIGILHTTSDAKISDNMINNQIELIRDIDFTTIDQIKIYNNSQAIKDARSTFMDLSSNEVRVEQKVLLWENPSDGVVADYRFINTSGTDIFDFHVGLYADFNLDSGIDNKTNYDASNQLSFTYTNDESLFAGIAVIENENIINSGINLVSSNGNTAHIGNELNDLEKSDLLRLGSGTNQAGVEGSGNDVAQMTSINAGNFASNEVKNISFVYVAGQSLLELQDKVVKARVKLSEYRSNPPILSFVPICPGNVAILNPPGGDIFAFYSDSDLNNLITIGNELITAPIFKDSIFYIVKKDHAYDGEPFQIMVITEEPSVAFVHSPDTLYLDENTDNTIRFFDKTKNSKQWAWDFGNGFSSILQNPEVSYFEAGHYTINLSVTNTTGCTGILEKSIVVIERSPMPNIPNQSVCSGESISLIASNSNAIRVYTDSDLTMAVFEGLEFNATVLSNDTTFFVTNISTEYESLSKEIFIEVIKPNASFEIEIDTTDLSKKTILRFLNTSQNGATYEWAVNGSFYSTDESPLFELSTESTLEITLISESVEGCTDISMQELLINEGPTPAVADQIICSGESAKIQPSNGEVFYFYSDPERTNLLHKGRSFSTDPIFSNTPFYITNIDHFAESPAKSIQIEISDFEAMYMVNPTLLNLNERNNAQFSDKSGPVKSRKWLINGFLHAGENPVVFFDNPGVYQVNLIVENEMGCIDTANFEYQVVNILGNSDELRDITIYPNPATGTLTILTTDQMTDILSVEILDAMGRKINFNQSTPNKNQIKVIIENYSEGIYFLKVVNKKDIYVKTFILKK